MHEHNHRHRRLTVFRQRQKRRKFQPVAGERNAALFDVARSRHLLCFCYCPLEGISPVSEALLRDIELHQAILGVGPYLCTDPADLQLPMLQHQLRIVERACTCICSSELHRQIDAFPLRKECPVIAVWSGMRRGQPDQMLHAAGVEIVEHHSAGMQVLSLLDILHAALQFVVELIAACVEGDKDIFIGAAGIYSQRIFEQPILRIEIGLAGTLHRHAFGCEGIAGLKMKALARRCQAIIGIPDRLPGNFQRKLSGSGSPALRHSPACRCDDHPSELRNAHESISSCR